MPRGEPIQTSFAGGEISPRAAGRSDSKLYDRALKECRNFAVLPQGPIRMRAGSVYVGEEASTPRLIAANFPDLQAVLALTNGVLRVWVGGAVPFFFKPVVASYFDFNPSLNQSAAPYEEPYTLTGTMGAGDGYSPPPGIAQLGRYADTFDRIEFSFATVVGHTYRVEYRVRAQPNPTAAIFPDLSVINPAGTTVVPNLGIGWTEGSTNFNAAAVTSVVQIENTGDATTIMEVDHIRVVDLTAGDGPQFTAPWTTAQIPDIQYVVDSVNHRVILVHPEVQPHVLTLRIVGGNAAWDLYPARFAGPEGTVAPTVPHPLAAWGGVSFPSCVEIFQGRLWFGNEPENPATVRASCSGLPFEFRLKAGGDGDGIALTLSARGVFAWIRGQRALFVGATEAEYAITGSNRIITPTDFDAQEESAFGSSQVQAASSGDQVLYASGDQRSIRALTFNRDENAWLSLPITLTAEHITLGGVREIHFARSPFPAVFLLLGNGSLVACTYERAEGVIAWWRVLMAGDAVIHSACVVAGSAGDELWVAVTRAGGEYIEQVPLADADTNVYVDSAVSGVVAGGGIFGGLAHLDGETVRVIVAGQLLADQVVAGGQVSGIDLDLVGEDITVGLAYTARAVTLPRNPKDGKVRNARLGVRLNDSAQPMINGWRPPERLASTPWDNATERATGKGSVRDLGWDGEGEITIEQDLPFRTEILSLFTTTRREET